MSPDEVMVLVMAIGMSVVLWAQWYAAPVRIGARRMGDPGARTPLVVAPPVAITLLFLVLRTLAASDVRDSTLYLFFYMTLGAAWIAAVAASLPLFGLSVRDDVLERGNAAAAWAIGGALIGFALAFAGGNIGDGPGWWVVIFASGLATITLFQAWMILDWLTHLSDTITIDRDLAAGMRLAGFLIGGGIILGRAAAGDWVSAGATIRDFIMAGWPILVLLLHAVSVERTTRPTPQRPNAPVGLFGIVPALSYIGLALLALAVVGAFA